MSDLNPELSAEVREDLAKLDAETKKREWDEEVRRKGIERAAYEQAMDKSRRQYARRQAFIRWTIGFVVLLAVAATVFIIVKWDQASNAKKQQAYYSWVASCDSAGGDAVGSGKRMLCVFDKATIPYKFSDGSSVTYEIPFIRECINAEGSFAGDKKENLVCHFPSGAQLKYR